MGGGVGLVSALRLQHWWWSMIVGWFRIGQCVAARISDIRGGVGLVSALRLGYWWWCRIGQCAVARISVVV